MAKRVLVADDSVTIQKAFAMSFAAEDVTLASARSADEGLSVARQFQPDLVIADGVMPGRSGYDLCAALKADRALGNVPVYILASAQNPFDEAHGRQVGAEGFFLKPFDSGALIDRVHDALVKAEGVSGVVSSSVAGRSNFSPPSMAIPMPSGADYGEDDYGEITIDSVPARDAPRATALAAPLPPPPAPSFAPLPAPPPAFAAPPSFSAPPVAAPGFTARSTMVPSSGAPGPGPGLRPSLIPGVRPGAAPAARPGIVPSGGLPAARGLSAPTLPPANLAPGPSPTLRPASIPTARTMVGMPVPRPGLSMPVPTPPARPGTGPVRTLQQPPAPLAPPPPAAPFPPASHAPSHGHGGSLVDQKVAEIAARGPEYEVLAKLSREVIEKIVWEIVPELTEAIVREELQKRGRA